MTRKSADVLQLASWTGAAAILWLALALLASGHAQGDDEAASTQKPAEAGPQKPAPSGAKTLDELLQHTQTVRERSNRINAEREARFRAARDEQKKLLAEAKGEKAVLDGRAAAMVKEFEANDKVLAELIQNRDNKAGNLGEMFGVVRQAAGDFASSARNSLISAQYNERIDQIDRLAQTKTLPPMEDLERFWFEMQREMTESGKVLRFETIVVAPDGSKSTAPVLRVGPFVAVSDGEFLEYTVGASALAKLPRQPPGDLTGIAEDFEEEDEGYQEMVVDPTRGVLLGLFAQRPTLVDRINQGEWVGYIILLVGGIGAVLAVYQFFFLFTVGGKVNAQLGNLGRLSDDNPLGRVLLAFRGKNLPTAKEEAEVVELRVSEAVLRELPPIERFQSFLKLAVAAGPLLGLVGTVIGMIHTFQVITESGSGDPKLMAHGIGQAMIATALGLGIAIPLLFANAALRARSKRISQILDEQSTGLLAELLERRPGSAARA